MVQEVVRMDWSFIRQNNLLNFYHIRLNQFNVFLHTGIKLFDLILSLLAHSMVVPYDFALARIWDQGHRDFSNCNGIE